MNAVFLDSVGLLAIWDEDDQWHAPADVVFRELVRIRVRLVTTTLIIHECGNAAARRPYRDDVESFRRELLTFGDLIQATPEEETEAWDSYRRGTQGDAGIVDNVSFVVMRRLGIRQAFTNDKHFAAAGFEVLF
jgi:uncharacterized protein